jgi:cytochrome P450
MRTEGPVIRARVPILGDVSFETGYGDCAAMLKDPARFSADGTRVGQSGIVGMTWWMPRQFRLLTNNMMLKDDPEHWRLRKLVDTAFHRGGVGTLRPRIAALTDDMLDRPAHRHAGARAPAGRGAALRIMCVRPAGPPG